jgi:hypothetical protein
VPLRLRGIVRAVLGITLALCAACGKKGPPLPPIVRTPSAPADVAAERLGNLVEIQLTVPSTNTDGTRPANVQRIDVYAFSGSPDAREDEVMRAGTRIAAVDVKAPRDPDDTIEPNEPSSDIEPLVGDGLDQGIRTSVREQLTAAVVAASPPAEGESIARTYLAVPVTTRGRHGPASNRAAVPLGPAPPGPAPPTITYNEAGIALEWPVAAVNTDEGAPTTYHVYEMPSSTRLTAEPLGEPRFVDPRVEWGIERCYVVRAVDTRANLSVLSEASDTACVTLKDTFAPATPAGLIAIPGEGAISLIWDPNKEKDLAGYRVLRGVAPDALEAVSGAIQSEATFSDKVPTGQQFFYAVQAADKAGNVSAPSPPVNDTAR